MESTLNTSGGTYVEGDVATGGGDFVGRDLHVHGDQVRGDKVSGNKTEFNISNVADGTVHIHIAGQRDLAPPLPDCPPKAVGFVGRDQDLGYYEQKLTAFNIALIAGMPGVGKTWLAARLALKTSSAEKIFWHRCLANEGIHALLWAAAAFLAAHDEPGLWQILQQSGRNELPPLNVLLNYLAQALAGQAFLICLDDVQHLSVDPGYERLVERMRQALYNREFRLIMTAQQALSFGSFTETHLLSGLTLADTRALLANQNIHLVEPVLGELYKRTAGNAQLLTLAIQALKHTDNQAKLIGRLVRAQEIKSFLLNQVDTHLTEQERLVLQAVAALLEWPGTADEIEEVLESQNVRRTLTFLSNRYLLEAIESDADTQYDAHAAVKSFYYETLSGRQRQAMHLRAAHYYEQNAQDDFKVALHYLKAQAYEKAARAATKDTFVHICTGRAQPLLALLEECATQPIDAELEAQVWIAKGNVYTFLQQLEPAQTAYHAALDSLAILPSSPTTHKVRGQAYIELGVLFRSAAPAEALKWLQAGLALLGERDLTLQADLQIQLGEVQLNLGNHLAARAALEQALTLLPRASGRLRLLALINLGRYHYYQNELGICSTYFTQALRMAEQLQHPLKILVITENLATLKQTTGDWAGALDYYTRATKLADTLGAQDDLAFIALNLGVLYFHQGELEQATVTLMPALEGCRQCELNDMLISGLTYWAELQLTQNAPAAAQTALAEAETLALTYQIEYMTPFLYTMQAHYFLAVTDEAKAQAYAERAIAAAHIQGMGQEEGQALRALGQSQLALHQWGAALESLQQSFALLATNPYEAACTQAVWGQALLTYGDAAQGEQLLRTARATFQTLGAKRAWQEVDALLKP